MSITYNLSSHFNYDDVTNSKIVELKIGNQILLSNISYRKASNNIIEYVHSINGDNYYDILEDSGLKFKMGNVSDKGYKYIPDFGISIQYSNTYNTLYAIKKLSLKYGVRTQIKILSLGGQYFNYSF